MRRIVFAAVASLAFGLTACGTEVDVGGNRERALEARARVAGEDGGDTDDDPIIGGDDAGGSEAANGGGDGDGVVHAGSGDAVPGKGNGSSSGKVGGTGAGGTGMVSNPGPSTGAGAGTDPSAGGTDPGTDPGGGQGTGSTGGSEPATGGGGTSAPLTCYGPAPALPPGFDQFCAIADPTLRATFGASFKRLCEDRRMLNLFLEPCSWNGVAPSDKFRRVLEKTALDDEATQDFAFYAVYALTTESGLEDQSALIRRELEDPNYADTFVAIRNSRVYDLAHNPDDSYDYTVELASSSATVKFRAHVIFVPLSPDLTVVFDYAVSDKVIVKEHHFLRFIQRVDAGHSRVVAIDEKLVADGGNHVLAYQNLTDVLKQRMERDYENSRRD